MSGSEILGPLLAGVLVAAAGAGWAIAVDAATFAVSAACLSMLRQTRRFVAALEGLFALPLAFLAAGAPAPLLAAGAFLSGLGMMLGMSVWESTLQRHIPADSLSRVASYDWFGSYAFYPLGLALWGSVAGAVGLHTALWLAFGLFGVMAALLLLVPDTRRFASARAPAQVI